MVFHDSTMVDLSKAGYRQLFSIRLTQLAENELGNKICANIVMLGAVVGSRIASMESLKKALVNNVRPQHNDLNLKALDLGFALGHSMR